MAAVKAIGRTRRRSSSRKVRGGAEGEGKAVSSSAIVATGPAKNGPIGYNYLLMPGNNSRVILAALRRRPWFGCVGKQEPLGSSAVNLVWEMWRSLQRCGSTPWNAYCALNHLDGQRELVSKKGLFRNLLRYCVAEEGEGDLNDIVPPTFLVKGKGGGREGFEKYVKEAKVDEGNCFGLEMPDYGVWGWGEEGEEGGKEGGEGEEGGNFGPAEVAEVAVADGKSNAGGSKNCESGSIWIVKPAASTNRGMGIKVCHGYGDVMKTITTPSKSKHNNRLTKKHGWIVQKYMEKPYLVHGRKFDLRVYVLYSINKETKRMDTYMHTEFYVRTSSVSYDVSKKSIKNSMMHLTNDAVQKKKKGEYGKFEAGNKLSAKELGEYFVEHSGKDGGYVEDVLVPQLRKIVKVTANAVEGRLNKGKRRFGFEMMGYDFMLDEDLKPWLIEVNSNPCLEQPCPLLERLIDEVIESTFEVAVDRWFPPPKTLTKKGMAAVNEIAMLKAKNQFVNVMD